MSDTPHGPGWWLASDGRYYAPELHPDAVAATSQQTPATHSSGRLGDVHDVRDTRLVPEAVFDALLASASGRPRLVATPEQYIDRYGSWNKGPWGLLITTEEVLVGRKKMTGMKIALRLPILEFVRFGVDQNPSGLWEAHFALDTQGQLSLLFNSLEPAEHTAEYINSGVLFRREGIG